MPGRGIIMGHGWKQLTENSGAAIIGLVLINVFWGASSIASKEALLQLTAVEVVTVRFAIAFVAVLAIALAFAPGALRVRLRDLPALAFLSVAGVSLQFVLQVTALVYTTATNFSLLFNLSAFFIMILGAVLLGERLGKNQLAGAVVAFAGVFLIVGGSGIGLSAAHLPGDLIGLASAALFGVYTIAARRVSGRFGPMTILVYTFFFGVLGLLPVYVLATPMTPLAGLNAVSWASLLFLALCCSVIAFLVYNHGTARLRSADVAMTIYVTPLAGVTLAVLLLGETLTAITLSGAALIMAGLYVSRERGPAGRAQATPEARDG
ncbi:MAG: O-acetylserine/cysteine export protein [Methanocella sp. PtaU1.Bin125]|nr:MAG: O-acetylserine/cysteine export protein [Methanocella sp. PtaU1.Bin125]